MKDLYLHLDLDPRTADEGSLRQAIDRCADPETARAAEFILLNAQRKQFYDRQHHLLTTIGQLRERLSIPRSPAWEELGNHDFDNYDPSQFGDLGLYSNEHLDEISAREGDAEFGEMGDVLNDLGLGDEEPEGGYNPSWRRRRYDGPFDPRRVMLWGGIAVGLCFLLLIVSSLRSNPVTFPENGHTMSWDLPNRSTVQVEITNPGRGHALVELTPRNGDRSVMAILVHEGESFTAAIPRGRYDVEFVIGKKRNWGGDTFLRRLREVPGEVLDVSKQKNIEVPAS